MYEIIRTAQFKRDVKKTLRRNKDVDKLKELIKKLVKGEALDAKYRDHPLKGDCRDYRDCHIEPDWILIHRIKSEKLNLIRTGSHSDLFL